MVTESKHRTGVRKGEELNIPPKEPGRGDHGHSGKKRPKHKTVSAEAYTGINPKNRNPIDPGMPHLQPA